MSNNGGVYTWSKTAASNASADSTVNYAEGQAPSSLNDSARAAMASVAKYRDDVSGSLITSGTAQNYILATNQIFDSLVDMDGQEIAFTPHATNTGTPVTMTVDSFANIPVRSSPGVELLVGALILGAPYSAKFNRTDNALYLRDFTPTIIADNAVSTSKIADAAVTLAKMANRATQTLIGRWTAGAGVPQEVSVGAGLVLNSTTGALSAPAFPVPGGFKNLSIKVASNTTVNCAADFVTTTDGTNFLSTALSGTINLGTAGIANALDTGTIAAATWYAIWAIAKADGTTAALASLSLTAPTMPTGYTYKARIGMVRTASGLAQLLGTWQLGRRAQYVVGLAQCTAMISVISGSSGSPTVPTWTGQSVSAIVPSTSSEIILSMNSNAGAAVSIMVAPNNSYGAVGSSTNPPPLQMSNSTGSQNFSIQGTLLLESASIYYASNGASSALYCLGWIDNI